MLHVTQKNYVYVFIYLFVVLFNDTASSSDYVVSNNGMNNELVRIWKKVVMVCFEVLSQHLYRGNEENHEKRWSG
jgi:hypothetical protein